MSNGTDGKEIRLLKRKLAAIEKTIQFMHDWREDNLHLSDKIFDIIDLLEDEAAHTEMSIEGEE